MSIYGRIWTNRWSSHSPASPKGRKERITRVYVGPNACQLVKDPVLSEPFGVQLNSDRSNWGTIKCKLQGEFVGHYNASFLVEGEIFGRKTYYESMTLYVGIRPDIHQNVTLKKDQNYGSKPELSRDILFVQLPSHERNRDKQINPFCHREGPPSSF